MKSVTVYTGNEVIKHSVGDFIEKEGKKEEVKYIRHFYEQYHEIVIQSENKTLISYAGNISFKMDY